ncbi:MAG: YHS domain-containing (seleno)protein [Pseudomonadota bacterium]
MTAAPNPHRDGRQNQAIRATHGITRRDAIATLGCVTGALATAAPPIAFLSMSASALAGANRQVVADPATGLALFGYDPLTYLVDGKARLGKSDYEEKWAGVTWRFVNIGNQKAFADAPDFYCPRYGGYDALGIARGLATAGKPVIFEVHENRVYLFYSHANRHVWIDARDAHIARAEQRWSKVRKSLAQ